MTLLGILMIIISTGAIIETDNYMWSLLWIIGFAMAYLSTKVRKPEGDND